MIHKHEIPILEFACYLSGRELRNSLFLWVCLFFLAERKQWKLKWLTKRIFSKENRFSRYFWWGFEKGLIWHQSPTTKVFSLQKCLWSPRGWVQVNVALILTIYLSLKILYNLRLVASSINGLSSKNHDAKGVKNPYENRERTPCSMNTRSFIFFTRILSRAQISSLTSEGFLHCHLTLVCSSIILGYGS